MYIYVSIRHCTDGYLHLKFKVNHFDGQRAVCCEAVYQEDWFIAGSCQWYWTCISWFLAQIPAQILTGVIKMRFCHFRLSGVQIFSVWFFSECFNPHLDQEIYHPHLMWRSIAEHCGPMFFACSVCCGDLCPSRIVKVICVCVFGAVTLLFSKSTTLSWNGIIFSPKAMGWSNVQIYFY